LRGFAVDCAAGVDGFAAQPAGGARQPADTRLTYSASRFNRIEYALATSDDVSMLCVLESDTFAAGIA
jgi:hypothetical protein